MYAIIQTGGKQYRVKKGQLVDVELLNDAGKTVEFNEVLLLDSGTDVKVGKPFVDKSTVKADVVGEVRGPKVESIKFKRRKQQRTHWGHRQNYTRLKITEIVG